MTEDPSKHAVVLSDRQAVPVDAEPLIDVATRTLQEEGVGPSELSISLVAELEMAELHERYAGEPGSTDVLSFPQDEDVPLGERRLLGDVVVCPAVAARQGSDLQAELRLLVVHGVLHLLGYDHEEEAARRAMWERQEAYSGVRVP